MKTITLKVSESVYAEFQRFAVDQDRLVSEIVREAMDYSRKTEIHPVRSLRDSRPTSVKAVLKPWAGRAELLGDRLDPHARD